MSTPKTPTTSKTPKTPTTPTNGDPLEKIKTILNQNYSSNTSPDELRIIEETLLENAAILSKENRGHDLLWTLMECRKVLPLLPKSKSSLVLRTILDYCLKLEAMHKEKIALVEECIRWADANKRQFLSRNLRARMIRLFNESNDSVSALDAASKLVGELRKLDEKDLLVEVAIEESKAAFRLNNPGKARTSLVTAKTAGNAGFMLPHIQAALDMQSGVLAADEKDYRTGYSYFYESFDNYEIIKETEMMIMSLKYMCLFKIMMDEADAVPMMLSGKRLPSTASAHLAAIAELGKAFEKRSLHAYHECCKKYPVEIGDDVVIKRHTTELYEKLFEKEVIRVVQPFDVVEIDQVVALIGLSREKVERKLAELILDKKLDGVIDQSAQTLTIYRTPNRGLAYQKAVLLTQSLTKTMDCEHSNRTRLL